MTQEEIENQKRVEYYAASVNAWFNTSLEHDKSLLTLSAGGIGLLLTLLTTVGLSSAEAQVLYIGAIASFVVALIATLVIFRRNRTHIEEILSGKSTSNVRSSQNSTQRHCGRSVLVCCLPQSSA